MSWMELKHSTCKLPTSDEISKVRALSGSLWKCGDPGCSKIYVLTDDMCVQRVQTAYKTLSNAVIINGDDEEITEYAGMGAEERDKLLMVRELEARTQMEIEEQKKQDREKLYKVRELERQVEDLRSALEAEQNRSVLNKLLGR